MINSVTFCRSIGDATRWRIAMLVRDEALCVCELADILRMPQSSVSSHVQILRKAGLLESERCGKWTYFRIQPRFRKLLSTLAASLGSPSQKTEAADLKRAVTRMEKRASSCCPGSVKLISSTSSKVSTRCCS
ncbi:helix-turn-helix transcriptional regulator [Luteolibacter ambystomatis]|uniref:Helix-turn-helix transcriptional regulator n=1 Tax=Luteolibacter ambystomatis TaxID=2824561 RepID=A0A975G5W5_9BACT|nr:metalloregulator ArsR/SmtB family transcription factor [Luteolibacter ambystomatis]QUE49331.1 helix-turn-helix transcriptional regulator [Luteolibacter ambystomatis]